MFGAENEEEVRRAAKTSLALRVALAAAGAGGVVVAALALWLFGSNGIAMVGDELLPASLSTGALALVAAWPWRRTRNVPPLLRCVGAAVLDVPSFFALAWLLDGHLFDGRLWRIDLLDVGLGLPWLTLVGLPFSAPLGILFGLPIARAISRLDAELRAPTQRSTRVARRLGASVGLAAGACGALAVILQPSLAHGACFALAPVMLLIVADAIIDAVRGARERARVEQLARGAGAFTLVPVADADVPPALCPLSHPENHELLMAVVPRVAVDPYRARPPAVALVPVPRRLREPT